MARSRPGWPGRPRTGDGSLSPMTTSLASHLLLLGVGPRRKCLYRGGVLRDLRTGQPIEIWDLREDEIRPADLSAVVRTVQGETWHVWEDDQGVWVGDGQSGQAIDATPVSLPNFAGGPHADLLGQLHHELLLNVVDGVPLPNLLAYDQPRFRDAAMACMALARTGHLPLVQDWLASLPHRLAPLPDDLPAEALGQVLYLLSLHESRDPGREKLIRTIERRAHRLRRDRSPGSGPPGEGSAVYQTRWLKFGLRSLGRDDPYEVPDLPDPLGEAFWMDRSDEESAGSRASSPAEPTAAESFQRPALAWARAHALAAEPPMDMLRTETPLTWEVAGQGACFEAMGRVSDVCRRHAIASPDTWHAAEALLYLLDWPGPGPAYTSSGISKPLR